MLQNAVFCDDTLKKPSASGGVAPDPYQGLCPWTPLGAYCGPQTPASFSSFFTFPQSHVWCMCGSMCMWLCISFFFFFPFLCNCNCMKYNLTVYCILIYRRITYIYVIIHIYNTMDLCYMGIHLSGRFSVWGGWRGAGSVPLLTLNLLVLVVKLSNSTIHCCKKLNRK